MTAAERSHGWDPKTLQAAELNEVTLGSGLRFAFRELGEGPPVLLLHGWPTSSFPWRGVMPAPARTHRVLAPDLPGFGASDKPTDVRYDFTFFDAVPPDDIGVGRHGAATGSAVSSGASLPACMLMKGHPSEAAGMRGTDYEALSVREGGAFEEKTEVGGHPRSCSALPTLRSSPRQ